MAKLNATTQNNFSNIQLGDPERAGVDLSNIELGEPERVGTDVSSTSSGTTVTPTTTTTPEENTSVESNVGEQQPSVAPVAAEKRSSTGMGAEAALGTEYSWNKQAKTSAEKTYSQDVLAAKQNLLTNRQNIENNKVNYQTQADMMKYQNNQNAEKVGWTGGYVLDQNRQMDYLKASIQAQMYGAMELQKYGYDSSLAAARLSYDLNQQEYARQYYNDAVSTALSEAQTTGTYFSAETKDMMSQLAVAEQKLKENPDDDIAKNIIDTINNWFDTNGISKVGVKTLEAWQAEQANALNWNTTNWEQYNAALEAAQNDISTNATGFIKYTFDENGNPVYSFTGDVVKEAETLDMNLMSGKELAEYIMQQFTNASGESETRKNDKAQQQVQSYIEYLYNQAESYATTISKDKDGNETKTYNYKDKNYVDTIKKMLDLINEINEEAGSEVIFVPQDYIIKHGQPKPGQGGSKEGSDNLWSNESTVDVTTDNGQFTLSLNGLSYLNWNDSQSILDGAYEFDKASWNVNVDNFPGSWYSTLKKQLNIGNSTLIETLPTHAFKDTAGNIKISGTNYSSDETSMLPNYNFEGLGGQIEYFLKDFYENTTGQTIKIGDMICIGDKILVWNGDDGKTFKQKNNARWICLNTQSNFAKELINL